MIMLGLIAAAILVAIVVSAMRASVIPSPRGRALG